MSNGGLPAALFQIVDHQREDLERPLDAVPVGITDLFEHRFVLNVTHFPAAFTTVGNRETTAVPCLGQLFDKHASRSISRATSRVCKQWVNSIYWAAGLKVRKGWEFTPPTPGRHWRPV